MNKSYDPKCEELARHFLASNTREELIKELAWTIQQSVEDWLTMEIDIRAADLKNKLN